MREYVMSRLRRQRRAFLATGVAIALAVAFMTVILAGAATMRQFVQDAAAPRARQASVVVTVNVGRSAVVPLTERDLAGIRALGAVAAASGVRETTLNVEWPQGAASTAVQSLPAAPGLAWFTVTSGREPAAPGEVLLDTRGASAAGVRPGDELRINGAPDGPAALQVVRIVGLFTPNGPQTSTRTLLAAEQDVARWTGDSDSMQEIDVLARPGADLTQVMTAVREVVPDQTVSTGAQEAARQAKEQQSGVDLARRIALGFAVISLLVALIVIANTFTIMLAQRSRELALLRCLGATRRHLTWASVTEAVILAGVASVVGAAVGLGLVVSAVAVASRLVGSLAGARPQVTLTSWAVPVLVGVVATVVSAQRPVRRATRVAPLAALRPQAPTQVRRAHRRRVVVSLLLAAVGMPVAWGVAGAAPSVLGGLLLVLAMVIAAPALVPVVASRLGAPFARLNPIIRLAVANTRREVARSAATSTALFVAVCLVTTLSVAAATANHGVDTAFTRENPLDIALTSDVRSGTSRSAGLPAALVDAVTRADGIAIAVGLRGVPVDISSVGSGKTPARDAKPPAGNSVQGSDPAVLRRVLNAPLPIADDVLLVPSALVKGPWLPAGASDGSLVRLTTTSGSVTLRLRVVPALPQMLVTTKTLNTLGASSTIWSVWAKAAETADPDTVSAAVSRAVHGLGLRGPDDSGPEGGVSSTDFIDYGGLADRASFIQYTRIMLAFSTALLGVAVVISLVGLANTMYLSVLERARESALSRAIGMTARQLRACLAVEAVLLSAVGAVLGLAAGAVLGRSAAAALLSGTADVSAPIIPFGRTAILVVGILAASVLAAVLPGRRAARISPTQALADA